LQKYFIDLLIKFVVKLKTVFVFIQGTETDGFFIFLNGVNGLVMGNSIYPGRKTFRFIKAV
jgi:hypothetical protein